MTSYIIGDIQGCYDEFMALLDQIDFNERSDSLWFVGDLVNRGPNSLGVLRFVKNLVQNNAHHALVLGNHDIHLLAIAAGAQKISAGDTLEAVLKAKDRDELVDWLRKRKFLHEENFLETGAPKEKAGVLPTASSLGETDLAAGTVFMPPKKYLMTHAGIYPFWTLDQAREYARELERLFASETYPECLNYLYGNEPAIWHENLKGFDRYRFLINAFTRMRYVSREGALELTQKESPMVLSDRVSDAETLRRACKINFVARGRNRVSASFGNAEKITGVPSWDPLQARRSVISSPLVETEIKKTDYLPWFDLVEDQKWDCEVIFGHWASLKGETHHPHIINIDTGCVWGGHLTAFRTSDGKRFIQPKKL